MRLYTLDDLPPRAQAGLRLSPTSSYVLQNAQVSLTQLLPIMNMSDRSSNQTSNRKVKKLDILRSIRRNLIENEYDLHHFKAAAKQRYPNDQTRNRDRLDYGEDHLRVQRKRSSKYSCKAGKKTARSVPKEAEMKFCKAKRNDGRVEVARQKSLKTFQNRRQRKESEIEKEVQATKLKHSKQLMKQIELERAREQVRRSQLAGLDGVQAHRLEKIHMIERLQAQKKLQSLKQTQDTMVQQLAMRQSFC